MLKGYLVKMGYSDEFFFNNIEEAATFYDQALRHSKKELKWTMIEPVFDHPEQDASEEESDAEKTDCKEDSHEED